MLSIRTLKSYIMKQTLEKKSKTEQKNTETKNGTHGHLQ